MRVVVQALQDCMTQDLFQEQKDLGGARMYTYTFRGKIFDYDEGVGVSRSAPKFHRLLSPRAFDAQPSWEREGARRNSHRGAANARRFLKPLQTPEEAITGLHLS